MNENHYGTLYVVATPIGNLQDISQRALHTLETVQCIAAEDTRHTAALLRHFSLSTPLISLHEHNERERIRLLLDRLLSGESVAIVSDAGTPLISDPGQPLVEAAREAGVRVVPIPGACALIAALSVAGLPTDRFAFEGFLPAKSSQRRTVLSSLCDETRTLIFYEAPHRLLDMLADLKELFGEQRRATLARELTKVHETIRTATLGQLELFVGSDKNQQRGECVVLVAGKENLPPDEKAAAAAVEQTEQVLEVLLEELPLKQAVNLTAKILKRKKNEVYDLALGMKK